MEKERRIKVLSLVALIIAVLGLTVAFAALFETLTINGTASVDAASWDIHFENLESNVTGDASITDEPVINETTISNINMTITKPNDSVTFLASIKNAGTIDAKISSIKVSDLCTLQSSVESCDWDNDGEVTQNDINKVNDNISFIVAYNDDGKALKENDTLNVGEEKEITFGLVFAKFTEIDGFYNVENSYFEATELPKRDLQFNDLSIMINYVQAD